MPLVKIKKFLASIKNTLKPGLTFGRKHWTIILLVFCALNLTVLAAAILRQPQLKYHYASERVCAHDIVLLPNWHQVTESGPYEVSMEQKISIGSFDIASKQICVKAKSVPKELTSNTVKYAFLGNKYIQQSVEVNAEDYPRLDVSNLQTKPISAIQPLELGLSKQDAVFKYALITKQNAVDCSKAENILCELKPLKFKQGKKYNIIIKRFLNEQPAGTLFEGEVKTAEPVSIKKTSVKNNATIYKPVKKIHLTTNRTLSEFKNVSLVKIEKSQEKPVEASVEIAGKKLIINFKKPLDWRSAYRLKVETLVSASQGELNKPYVLNFKTSGGPKVTGANIASYNVPTTQNFNLYFDQAINKKQNFSDKVTLSSSLGNESFTASVLGKTLVINPARTLPVCTNFTLKINSKIANPYKISGDSSRSYQFRSRCAVTSVIGYSVEGRPIYAYSFGKGSSEVVYVGAMHGNEQGTKYMLDSWINDLEANPQKIPSNRKVVVIPNVNPDGFARAQRLNVRSVDLNRNFPTNDWTENVYGPDGNLPKGGGKKPLSEPESKALAGFITQISPRLVLTYHSVAGVVIPNGSGDSLTQANRYGAASGYNVAFGSEADGIFSYATTGEFEDWLQDKLGIPALLVELYSHYGNEFYTNKEAMWKMVTVD